MPGKKILLVDDETNVITSLHRELFPWTLENGVEIVTAETGDEALEIVHSDPGSFAIIISDLKMPGLSGSDLLLKVNETNPNIMTMLLTGYTDTSDIIKAVKAGVFSYILKPWDRQYLLTEVRKAFDIYIMREEHERNQILLRDDLRWAGELQRSLLAFDPPASEKVRYSFMTIPRSEFGIGGDYYDVLRLDESRHIIFIGDVAGHGVKAAFLTFVLKTLISPGAALDAISSGDGGLSRFLGWVNTQLCAELRNLPDVLITMTMCLLNVKEATLTIANAGNPPFHILRRDEVVSVHVDGPGMGFRPEVEYEEKKFLLQPHDRVLFYTDGLAELLDSRTVPEEELSEREPLGLPTVEDVLRPLFAEEYLVPALIEMAKSRAHGDEFADDVTVVSIDLL